MRVERGARDLLWKAETETRGKRERMNEWVGREDRRWNDKQTDRDPLSEVSQGKSWGSTGLRGS